MNNCFIEYVTATNKPATELKSTTEITSLAGKISTAEITSPTETKSPAKTKLPAEITSPGETKLPSEITSPAEIISPTGLSSSTENTINLPDPQVNETEDMLPNTSFNIKYNSTNCYFHNSDKKIITQSCSTTKQFKLQSDYTVTKYDNTVCFVKILNVGDDYQFVSKDATTLCLKLHIKGVAETTNWRMILLNEFDQKTIRCLRNNLNVNTGGCGRDDNFFALD